MTDTQTATGDGADPKAGTGADPAPAKAGANGANGGAGNGAATGEGTTEGLPYRPQGLPDHFLGASDKETIDRLFQAYDGARTELARRPGSVPKDASAYELKLSEEAASVLKLADDDKAVGALKELAHKHGLTDRQFGGMFAEFVDTMLQTGIVPKPRSGEEILAELAPADFKGPDDQKVAAGEARYNAAKAWVTGLGLKDEAAVNELLGTITTPGGLAAIEHIMRANVQASVSAGGGTPAGGITKAQLDARVADPRNYHASPQYDAAFAAETQRLFREFYGE